MDVLLTRNMKHLRTAPVLAAGVKVITSDEFLVDLLNRHRQGVLESFTRVAASKKSPPVTALQERDISHAVIDARIAERAAGVRLGATVRQSGQTTVSIDDDGNLVEIKPDGTRHLL
ncbi:MAG: hypothetical protein QM695_08140 [Micropruina sp.]